MIPESALVAFLKQVRAAGEAGQIANAQQIAQNLFGEPWHESMVNVVDECRRRGFLSRADMDFTAIAISPAGEAFLNSTLR